MTDRSVIDKIKGLYRLSKDPCNEHEAALAAERVRDLLEKHNLSLGEILNDQSEAAERAWEKNGRPSLRVKPHTSDMARACAQLFDVEWFIDSIWNGMRDARGHRVIHHGVIFCGIPQNVETALVTMTYFDDCIRSLMLKRTEIRARKRRVAYKRGAGNRLYHEALVLKAVAMAAASEESTALVHVGNAIAKRCLEKHKLHARPDTEQPLNKSFMKGYADGGYIPLRGAGKKQLASRA